MIVTNVEGGNINVTGGQIQIIDEDGHIAHVSHDGLTVTDFIHHMTRHALVYRISHRWDALEAGNTAGVLIHTPQAYPLDFTFSVQATGLVTVDFREQPKVTDSGTPIDAFRNKNRQDGSDDKAAGLAFYYDPTVTAGSGRFLVRDVFGGAAQGQRTLPGDRAGTDWVLRRGLPYYIEIVNTTAGTIYVAIRMAFFSEHT